MELSSAIDGGFIYVPERDS